MFFKSLFDFNFQKFVTRQVASVLYALLVGLTAIASVVSAIISLTQGQRGLFVVGAILALLGGLVFIIVLRLIFEAGIALVVIAENTKKEQ